jgi:ketol-acid reductoisomerase
MISLLIPDQVMGEVYKTHIAPNIKEKQTLLFAHGYNIHYKVIQPPEFINVVMAAPSGAGTELRKQFQAGKGIPGLFAIEQDYTQDSQELLLSYCKAIGLTRMGVFESTFKEETETDLFGEQIILTGGIPKLIQSSYKVLLESGYSPVTAWFVCYYELKTIVDMFHSKGFEFMNSAISDTAEYGGITRGKRIIDKHVENEMRSALKEIQSGEFHKEWQKEAEDGFPTLSKLREEEKNLPIQKIGNSILKDLFEKK